jgi:hypothetical protein
MKKLVKVVLFVVVMVMVVAYSFVINRGSDSNITLDFENSGSPEWFELVEGKTFQDFVTMDFENSGSPEWFELVEGRGFRKGFNRFNDFKNSGLPETIEFSRF